MANDPLEIEPCEVWFYHLERSDAGEVLPDLLERTLARGWRALVLAGGPERLDALGGRLWAWREDAFLAHGRADGPSPERQPILLSEDGRNLNGARALFLLDGAEAPPLDGYLRCLDLFDGRDPEAVAGARRRWRSAKAQGALVSYWRQTEAGRWEKQA